MKALADAHASVTSRPGRGIAELQESRRMTSAVEAVLQRGPGASESPDEAVE